MRALLALGWAVAALGCTEPVREHRDGGEDVPDCQVQPSSDACDPASRDNVMFTWSKAVCGLLLDCCLESDRAVVAEQLFGEDGLTALSLREPAFLEEPFACRRAIATALITRFRDDYQSLDDGRRRFDRDAARDCLSWYQRGAAECVPGLVLLDETHQPKACGRMFPAVVEAGGICAVNEDCVRAPDAGMSTCQSNAEPLSDGGFRWATKGTCRAVPALGEFCPLPWSDCGRGRFCAADQRCRARAPVDELCLTELCEEAAYCDAAQRPAKCMLRKTNYEPCVSSLECQEGLSCDPRLGICLEGLQSVNPLDAEFTFCLGPSDHRVARALPGVPADGGL